jgi:twitching motility protein PilI
VAKDIFSVISDVVSRFGQSTYGLPAQKEIVETRKLVSFSVLGDDYVMPLNELSEVLDVPECTKLPRVKSWVRGLANVRGRLLPIIDLADFLGGSLAGSFRDRRVLVLDMDGIYVGLIVDAVQGIKSLAIDHYKEARNNGPLVHFIDGSFSEEDKSLPLFCAQKLIEDSQFMSVSV